MKTLRNIICGVLVLVFGLTLTACNKDNSLDLNVYCKDTVAYAVNNVKDEGTFDLSKILDGNSDMNAYTKIQITTAKDWTYGLEIERIEFDILLSAPADVDVDITVSNLENGANFNESKNTYYFHKTLAINKENTNVKLDILDVFTAEASVISIEINKSCYTSNPDLKIGIGNLKMFGQHTPANY